MLSTDKVYSVTVFDGDEIAYKYVAYGATVFMEDNQKSIHWYDSNRFRITQVKEILEDELNVMKIKDSVGYVLAFELITLDIFDKNREDLFATSTVFGSEFVDDAELQKYLISLRE